MAVCSGGWSLSLLFLRNSEVIVETTGVCENCNGVEQSLHPPQHGHHCGGIVSGALQYGKL